MNTNADSNSELLMAEAADQFTASIERGENPSIAEFADRFPQIADAIRRVFPALRAIGDKPKRKLFPSNVERLDGFQLIEEIGRGGMGIVFRAQEIDLARTVAVKVLPFVGFMEQNQINRFKNESRAAATLNHRNIVPIYSVGTDHDVHYYAMRMVEGMSMAEWVDRLREQNSFADETQIAGDCSSNTEFGTAEFFQCVARFGVQAAEGLEHAHRHGIIHRDIKPGNLMIENENHLWITDFGLARLEGASSVMTNSGDLLGTIRYMSPEQAQTNKRVVDHRTDLYSLGATLYELCILRPIFTGDDRLELLNQIAFSDPIPPRKVFAKVPKDLETIILKSIEKNPHDRYASAQELADDLQRFLDFKPIEAKTPSVAGRLTRWSIRHQPIVWAGLATMVLTIITLFISTWMIGSALKTAEQQRGRAEVNLNLALDVIDETYVQEIERLRDEPGMTLKQSEALERIVRFYEQLPQEDLQDHSLRHKVCNVRLNLGEFYQLLGRSDKAIAAYHDAVAATSELSSEFPENAEYLSTLVRCYDGLGTAFTVRQQVESAIDAHQTALRMADQLAERFPDSQQIQELVTPKTNLGLAQPDMNSRETTLRSSKEKIESRLERFPASVVLKKEFANVRHHLGLLLFDMGRNREAEEEFSSAVSIRKKLVETEPDVPQHRFELADSQKQLSVLFGSTKREKDAETATQDAQREFAELVRLYPHRAKYKNSLAQIHNLLGRSFYKQERFEDAADSFSRSKDLFRELNVRSPETPLYRANMAISFRNMSNAAEKLNQRKLAQSYCEKAVEMYEQLHREFPNNPDYEAEFAITRAQASGYGDLETRLKSYQHASEVLQDLAVKYPKSLNIRENLIRCQRNLGLVLNSAKRVPEAEQQYRVAIKNAEEFSESFPEIVRLDEAATEFMVYGTLSQILGKHDQAVKAHGAAVERFQQLCRAEPENEVYRSKLCSNLKRLGNALTWIGKNQEAETRYLESLAIARELANRFPQDPEYLGKQSRRLSLLGFLYINIGDLEKARKSFAEQLDALTRLKSDFSVSSTDGLTIGQTCSMLINVMMEQERSNASSDAVDVLSRVIKERQDENELVTALELKLRLADLYYELEDTEKFAKSMAEVYDALMSADNSPQPPKELSKFRWPVANRMRLIGKPEYGQALAEATNDQPAMAKLEMASEMVLFSDVDENSLAAAFRLVESGIRVAPKNARLRSLRGCLNYRLGRPKDAVADLTASINQSGKGTIFSLYFLAMAQAKLGEMEKAKEAFETGSKRAVLVDSLHRFELLVIRKEAAALLSP